MTLLTVEKIRKHFGPDPVLDGVSFELRAGDKLGLVGPNGAGKTTLLRIVAGQLEPDMGTVALQSSARIGVLEQQPQFAPGRTVWEEAADALADLKQLGEEAERLAQQISLAEDPLERRSLGERFDRLQYELHHRDAYHTDHKIERVLDGLGFARSAHEQLVQQLSGGQQNRLLMAKLLLTEPDVMLLDEPSNHLDIDATQWLEEYLLESTSALLVVSHDRYFLDRVTNRTLELFQATAELYTGNYTAYLRQKAERLEVQRRTYQRQQEEIAKIEDFVRRNHYGQKHAQAEDRRKKLERIERVSPPREIAAPPMGFPAASRTGDMVIRAEGLAKAYAQPLFQDLRFDVLRGEKWGVLGPNGCGKTTLLLCLLGRVPFDAGRVLFGAGVKCAFFDQQLADLDDALPPVEAVRPAHKDFTEQQRRDLLARFGLTGDLVYQPLRTLSGGERNRTALARLSASDANVLILDEPTNHLDLWSRAALERALREFAGTVIFVSHDRYFLNQVADRLLVVEPGRFRVIDGNYDTYRHLVARGFAQEARAALDARRTSGAAATSPSAKPRSDDQPRRKRQYPYRKVADLEAEIHHLEQAVAAWQATLCDPDTLRNGPRVKQVMAELQDQQGRLTALYQHLEEAIELN